MQPMYETNSDNISDNTSDNTSEYNQEPKDFIVKKVKQLKDFYQGSSIKKNANMLASNKLNNLEQENLACKLCNNLDNTNLIILSCNHIFHIKCLAETYFKDVYNYEILDDDYFNNNKCTICSTKLEKEEIMFLHSKFLSNTKISTKNHQNSIDNLENQLKQIKEELRTCYDYKHKLEKQGEKSKQIISILNTLL